MNEIALRDHTPVRDPACQVLCREIQDRIDAGSCRLVDLLDEDARDDPSLSIFQAHRDGTLWTRQYVGFLEYRDTRIIISSRFDRTRHFYLRRLLENFLGEALLALDGLTGALNQGFFDQLLTASFALQVQRAWTKGPLRAYRSFPRNDSHVRGVIDVPRHIRENLGLHNGRAAYRTRAYSLDNPWNVLLLQAAAAARKRNPALIRRLEGRLPEFRAALGSLALEVPGWERPQAGQVLDRTRRRIENPVFREWEPARRTARALLARMASDPFADSGTAAVTGVFLNMDRLWELLLEDALFRGAADGDIAQNSFTALGGQMGMIIKPDFYFPSCRTVLDAKNRPAWGETFTLTKRFPTDKAEQRRQRRVRSAVRDDAYQVLTYMLALDCSAGGVVFPMSMSGQSVPAPARSYVRDGRTFWRIPVGIPEAEDYGTFCRVLREQFDALRRSDPVRELLRPDGPLGR